ncbi:MULTISPECIES: hypothetical protein [Pseudomonas]|uniref:hypothetical protein n=1 Tax=Pseudomonas TaxID=286 RepID=UPI0034D59FAF
MIPVARDAGGFLICLNLKTDSIPVEIFVPNSNNIYFVANSLMTLLNCGVSKLCDVLIDK